MTNKWPFPVVCQQTCEILIYSSLTISNKTLTFKDGVLWIFFFFCSVIYIWLWKSCFPDESWHTGVYQVLKLVARKVYKRNRTLCCLTRASETKTAHLLTWKLEKFWKCVDILSWHEKTNIVNPSSLDISLCIGVDRCFKNSIWRRF